MKVQPIEARTIITNIDVTIIVNISPKQKWEAEKSKISGRMLVTHGNVKLNMSEESFNAYFKVIE